MMSGRRRLRAYENVVNQKPGPELLGDRGAADEMAPLEDQGLQAGLREIGAVDEAVVAAADDDRVVGPVRLRGRLSGGSSPGRSAWPLEDGVLVDFAIRRSSDRGCRAAAG